MTNTEVTGIYIHPIKGCGAVPLRQAGVTEMGLQYDREWILCGPDGGFMSQRKEPELALVQPMITDGSLVVTAPGMGSLAVSLEAEGPEKPVEFFKKGGMGQSQGADAAGWFSEYLGKDVELFRVSQPRTVKPECQVDGATSQVGFADAFPLLITSEASLAELNSQLATPVPMDRFRPNIVVNGDSLQPYDEDYWRKAKIGDLTLFVVRACARCPVPDTDQATGVRNDRPVTAALRATRHGIDPVNDSKGNFFGQNAVHVFEPGMTVSLGDVVTVLDRSQDRNLKLA